MKLNDTVCRRLLNVYTTASPYLIRISFLRRRSLSHSFPLLASAYKLSWFSLPSNIFSDSHFLFFRHLKTHLTACMCIAFRFPRSVPRVRAATVVCRRDITAKDSRLPVILPCRLRYIASLIVVPSLPWTCSQNGMCMGFELFIFVAFNNVPIS